MNLSNPPKSVAIIGAGLSGLSLGLALHALSIPCKIFELRNASYNQGGGIMLSPNALRILDDLGVYERIRSRGYSFEYLTVKNAEEETTGRYCFGDEKLYGYKALRIYRQVLIEELSQMVKEQNIPIFFEKKFLKVNSESEEGVAFEFTDGSVEKAALLIGADGVYSKLRYNVDPTATPHYSGIVAITTALQASKLRYPKGVNFPLPVSMSCKPGVFVLAPQNSDGTELLAGTQKAFAERDRAGWEKLAAEKGELMAILRKDIEDWPDIVQSALENMSEEKLTTWPFYTVPKLAKWFSKSEKIILVGDAAHGLPPTTGQGVNQAFEDVYTLSLLLSGLSTRLTLSSALNFWQDMRQKRIDKIIHLTKLMNNMRLPAIAQAKLAKEEVWHEESDGQSDGQRWLYEPDLKQEIMAWVDKQQ